MEKKVLFVTYKKPPKIMEGGGQGAKKNYDMVCAEVGQDNVVCYYVHDEEKKKSVWQYLLGAFFMLFNYYFGLTPGRVKRIVRMAADFDVVFQPLGKDRKAWKVVNDRCRVFDVANYDRNRYSVNYSGEPYLSGNDLRVSQDTGSTLFPHEIAVLCRGTGAPPAGEKFTPVTEIQAAELDFKDWLLVISGSIPESTGEFMSHAVFNPGVLYYAPGLIFLNRRASSLAGCDALPLEMSELKKLFPADKRWHWTNWKTPDSVTMAARWRKFLNRCSDSWFYRRGLMLEKLGVKR